MLDDIQSFPTFDAAVHAVIAYLHQRIGFGLWMVTRVEGEDWIVLQASDHYYGVSRGDVFRWTDSFCYRMVNEDEPRIAPCANAVLAYANAPIASQLQIGAYVGVPLTHNGKLFGTLCGIDPDPQSEAIVNELPVVELLAKLLSTLLYAELAASEQLRRAERAQNEAMHDALTGLYNRRGWDNLLALEESRCQQYGHPACVISIDLDGLKQINDTQGHAKGDDLIRQAGEVLQNTLRKQDIIARLGGDEFGILCVECSKETGSLLAERLRSAMKAVGISASVGVASRRPDRNLLDACELADQLMYKSKRIQNYINSCS